jgi:hypothetical protein
MSFHGTGAFALAIAAAIICNAAGGAWWETLIVAACVVYGSLAVVHGKEQEQDWEEHRRRMEPVYREMNREREEAKKS